MFKRIAKAVLGAVGLLGAARELLLAARRLEKQRYYRRLVGMYRDPLSKPRESYSSYSHRERQASRAAATERYVADQQSIMVFACDHFSIHGPLAHLSGESLERTITARYSFAGDPSSVKKCADRVLGALSALAGVKNASDRGLLARRIAEIVGSIRTNNSDRRARENDNQDATDNLARDQVAFVRAILDRVLDRNFAVRFYDYDYIDDIVGVVGGRFCSDLGADAESSTSVLDALSVLVGSDGAFKWSNLPAELRKLLGNDHGYAPMRGDVSKHVWNVTPDMAEEFIALKAEKDPQRFLEINREYSRRQAIGQGLWDNREISLLRGYERDHHLLIRTLVDLICSGQLTNRDKVLLIGPRHVDEVSFFRRILGLTKTTGLDLFDFGKDEIIGGDMHHMPFEENSFKMVYCAGTLSYSYNVRKVVSEIARVLERPGFVFLVDAAGRLAGPDALGRSDVVGVDALIGLFFEQSFDVIARDAGRSLAPKLYENEPCVALTLKRQSTADRGFSGRTDLTSYFSHRQ